MSNCQFSETQFVFGYMKEYLDSFGGLKPSFVFPSTATEPEVASDLILQNFSHLEFFQFKRAHCLNRRRGKNEIDAGIPKSFRPYYRFKIYNTGSIPQFDRLRDIARTVPFSRVFYCAPKFHEMSQFRSHFQYESIMLNSLLINCNHFNTRSDHYIVYNQDEAYMCSQKIKLKTIKQFDYSNNENTNKERSINIINGLQKELLSWKELKGNDFLNGNNPFQTLQKIRSVLFANYNINSIIRLNKSHE